MASFFGAIADDFTGATDLAGLLARSGVRVSLRIGVPDEAPMDTAPLEIIALKSRTALVADAVAETQAALAWLQQAGATRFFWKYCSTFDSTPQGNIGPVAEALMATLQIEQTIYCPAFPENGRAIFMGNLFVGDQPLAESPMKDHPLTPMRDSNLMRLLAPQVTRPVGLANRHVVASGVGALRERLAALRDQGCAHVVVDAVANDDLVTIAQACQDMVLLTGGSALAMPLPQLWIDQGMIARTPGGVENAFEAGPAIILSGSCSAMTNQQVRAYLAGGHRGHRLDPVHLAEHGGAAALAWLAVQPSHTAPIVYATAMPEDVRLSHQTLGAERAGKLVEDCLAECAREALRIGFRRFVVAGGETSGAVTQALGVARLDVGDEIAPGVPWCFAKSNGKEIALALKSGNFGNADFFDMALKALPHD